MTEVLDEVKLRPKNQMTLPGIVIDILNMDVGDFIRFTKTESGDVCVCKAVTHKVNHVRCENGSC